MFTPSKSLAALKLNINAAQRELDQRNAEGEDVSHLRVNSRGEIAALLYAYAPIPALAGVLKCQGILDDNMSAIVYGQDFTADQVVVLSGYRGDRIYSVDRTPFQG